MDPLHADCTVRWHPLVYAGPQCRSLVKIHALPPARTRTCIARSCRLSRWTGDGCRLSARGIPCARRTRKYAPCSHMRASDTQVGTHPRIRASAAPRVGTAHAARNDGTGSRRLRTWPSGQRQAAHRRQPRPRQRSRWSDARLPLK